MWFLTAIARAIHQAQRELDAVSLKTRLWQRWAGAGFNARQVKLLNEPLDAFEGKINHDPVCEGSHVLRRTALRDITLWSKTNSPPA
jgi:Fic family protein